MFLFPTEEEMRQLYKQINPTERIMDFLYSRPPAEGSMAEFFMESEDMELIMEDDAIPFDEIEDGIVSMRRDINGFKLSRPRYLEHNPNSGHLNFKGWSFETIRDDGKPDTKDCPYVENLSSWDDI